MYPPDESNYGRLNLAAGSNYLLINYEHFDKVNLYLICGFHQHIDESNRRCVNNAEGFYTIALPNFKFGFKMRPARGQSCALPPDQKMSLNYVERSKLQFICAYMRQLEYQKEVELRASLEQIKEDEEENQGIFKELMYIVLSSLGAMLVCGALCVAAYRHR